MVKISTIIPVFNAEKYLRRCLDSVILAMEGVSGEILAIDNNSSDDSLLILKEYAKKYPKLVSVLQCHTPGAAAVRNYGVTKARGEYIWFIDADDFIAEYAINRLVGTADSSKADLVMMGAERIYPNGERNYLSPVLSEGPEYKSRFVRYGMGPWQVLIRRKWWLKYGFCFREGLIHEDMELMSALILYTDNLASVDAPLYYYTQNEGSVLHKKVFNPQIFDIFPVLEGLYKRFEKAGAETSYHDELEWFFVWNLLIDSAKDFGQFPEGRSGFTRSREMLRKYFPKWRKNRFLKQKPIKLQMRVRLNYWK